MLVPDSDGDGFGDLSVVQSACEQPNGYVLNSSDCTDLYASVYPSAPELCDGMINDCLVSIIESSESDVDGDGYVECTIDSNGWQGDSSVLGGDDCDDTNALISPSAVEICDGTVNICGDVLSSDEIDNDGDGYVECPIDVTGWTGTSMSLEVEIVMIHKHQFHLMVLNCAMVWLTCAALFLLMRLIMTEMAMWNVQLILVAGLEEAMLSVVVIVMIATYKYPQEIQRYATVLTMIAMVKLMRRF